ncbi:hypothetical protein [Alterisphingorhabdus coralli]|uniref:Uncharacterized protein n=1 Tax=Alterisphingorhabdus coralli TaxID=3071408 RepID=A0AA97F9E6_9SPHN|nr:hypothetical protein [Parasphingorhabdus sp. SCSIO 66989]WOE76336.1 hypothetical protein RB602_06385 [Parasphingorhabdus sp. SCSIO 66989]
MTYFTKNPPFVQVVERNGEEYKDYWCPERTGDRETDLRTGKSYAEHFLANVEEDEIGNTLSWIVGQQFASGRFGHVEKGFIKRIADNIAI